MCRPRKYTTEAELDYTIKVMDIQSIFHYISTCILFMNKCTCLHVCPLQLNNAFCGPRVQHENKSERIGYF